MKARGGRGALVVLALLLASSAALRLGSGVGAALAKATDETTEAAPAASECPVPPAALAAAMAAREAELAQRGADLDQRMAALALADKAVTMRMTELEAAEAELKATLSVADGAAEKDLARLTAVYEAMKPTDAAALFQTMAPEFSAGFLGRMRPDAAAAVLAGMTPESAYSISVLIAGRNALAPKN